MRSSVLDQSGTDHGFLVRSCLDVNRDSWHCWRKDTFAMLGVARAKFLKQKSETDVLANPEGVRPR
jgi:hypothetical protein